MKLGVFVYLNFAKRWILIRLLRTPNPLVKNTLVKKTSPSNGAGNASAEFIDFKKTRVP